MVVCRWTLVVALLAREGTAASFADQMYAFMWLKRDPHLAK